MYLIAIVMTLISAAVIVKACILHTSAVRAAPVNIYQLK
jgi:hypothetical protein